MKSKLTSAILILLMVSCAGGEKAQKLDLPVMHYSKDGVTMVLLGTVHALSPDHYNQVELRDAISNLVNDVSLVFIESDVSTMTPSMREQMAELTRGDESRPSIGDYIKKESTEFQEQMLTNISRYPMLDHVGRRDNLLSLRPHMFEVYLNMLNDSLLGRPLDKPLSVEELIGEAAVRQSVPLKGLQEPLLSIELYDSMNQEPAMKMFYTVMEAGIEAEDLKRARETSLEENWKNFISADYSNTSRQLFFQELGITDTIITESYSTDLAKKYFFTDRETTWVDTLDTWHQENKNSTKILVAVGYLHLNPEYSDFLSMLEAHGWNRVD